MPLTVVELRRIDAVDTNLQGWVLAIQQSKHV